MSRAIIRNQQSGLVLDVNLYGQVILQYYSGIPSQIWFLEPTFDNKFIFINTSNGLALDIEGGACDGANLITYEKHGGINQQWYVNPSEFSIISACGDLSVDVMGGTSYPGANIIAYQWHGGPNQRFLLEYQ